MLIILDAKTLIAKLKRKKTYLIVCGILYKGALLIIFTTSLIIGFRKDDIDEMKFCISITLLFLCKILVQIKEIIFGL